MVCQGVLQVLEQAGCAAAPTLPPEWAKCTGLLHHRDWGAVEMWAALHPSSHSLAQLKLSGDFSSR